jgi:hypothetical protein
MILLILLYEKKFIIRKKKGMNEMNQSLRQVRILQPKRNKPEYELECFFADHKHDVEKIKVKYDGNGKTEDKNTLTAIFSESFMHSIAKCIRSFEIVQQQIDEGTLEFHSLTFQQKEGNYQCDFRLNDLDFLFSMTFKPFLRNKTNNRVYAKETFVVINEEKIVLDSRITALLEKRVLYYLVKKSTYRPKLLFDHNFSYYQKTAHFLKKGDHVKITFKGVTYGGKNEGIIQSFFISDENTEMAVVEIGERNWNWFISGVEKIKDE